MAIMTQTTLAGLPATTLAALIAAGELSIAARRAAFTREQARSRGQPKRSAKLGTC